MRTAIEIRWPSDLVRRWANVAGNQIEKIRENVGVMEK
jgi:hypothetical protein